MRKLVHSNKKINANGRGDFHWRCICTYFRSRINVKIEVIKPKLLNYNFLEDNVELLIQNIHSPVRCRMLVSTFESSVYMLIRAWNPKPDFEIWISDISGFQNYVWMQIRIYDI